MLFESGDRVKVTDVRNYPPAFGIVVGSVGKVQSVFTSKGGHKVANVDFGGKGKLKGDSPTHPVSFTRLDFA